VCLYCESFLICSQRKVCGSAKFQRVVSAHVSDFIQWRHVALGAHTRKQICAVHCVYFPWNFWPKIELGGLGYLLHLCITEKNTILKSNAAFVDMY
jgi:hypothetical protein